MPSSSLTSFNNLNTGLIWYSGHELICLLSPQDDLVNKMCHNPRKIFNLPEQPNTYIEVNLDEVWTIPEETCFSKAKWTPFAGTDKVIRQINIFCLFYYV